MLFVKPLVHPTNLEMLPIENVKNVTIFVILVMVLLIIVVKAVVEANIY